VRSACQECKNRGLKTDPAMWKWVFSSKLLLHSLALLDLVRAGDKTPVTAWIWSPHLTFVEQPSLFFNSFHRVFENPHFLIPKQKL